MWRYRNISSDFQRPISLMMSVSTCARRNAVAPAAHRHLADTSHDKTECGAQVRNSSADAVGDGGHGD